MGCFAGCSGNSNKKKKRSDNSNHHHNHIVNSNFKNNNNNNNNNNNKAQDHRTSSTSDESAAKQQFDSKRDVNVRREETREAVVSSSEVRVPGVMDVTVEGATSSSKARTFTYQELVDATDNFRSGFLGEGGFGKVYKGKLLDTSEVVAIKQLDRNGLQGIREFIVEVLTLSLADHPNLVKLIGYCAEGDQRLLVYEYMPLGSLETHLHDLSPKQKALDWNTRMRIAAGAARGLEYLHDKMKPPVIYRDLKCSNILLGEGYHPKLSDFGLAKVGPVGDNTHVSTRVMGTYGYCAPDYAMTGQLTFKSDIYSFGVVLLELITGRKAIDNAKDGREQNLVAWAKPLFKDRRKFPQMADPALEGHYPSRGLYQALAIAAMCTQEQPTARPNIIDVVTALNYLASQDYDPDTHTPHHRRTLSSSNTPHHLRTPSSSNTPHHRRTSSSSNIKKDSSKKPEDEDSQSDGDSEDYKMEKYNI